MEKLTFYGIDADNQTSLLEYGILVSNEAHEDGSGTHFVVYKIDSDSFGTGHFNNEDIDLLLNGNDWMNDKDIRLFLDYCGEDKDSFLSSSLANKLHSLISYFGTENICGTDYCPINEVEAIERYL